MKKALTLLSLLVLTISAHHSFAQAEYSKGNVILNAGFGFGYYYAGGVPLIASAEFALSDVVSVGPYLGFTSYRYNAFGYKWNYTFIDVGVRGSYHFSKHLKLKTDDLDLYGGALLGYVVSSYSGDAFSGYNDPYASAVRFGLFGGARYYFTKSFAVDGELGFGIAPLLLGVSFKL